MTQLHPAPSNKRSNAPLCLQSSATAGTRTCTPERSCQHRSNFPRRRSRFAPVSSLQARRLLQLKGLRPPANRSHCLSWRRSGSLTGGLNGGGKPSTGATRTVSWMHSEDGGATSFGRAHDLTWLFVSTLAPVGGAPRPTDDAFTCSAEAKGFSSQQVGRSSSACLSFICCRDWVSRSAVRGGKKINYGLKCISELQVNFYVYL